MNLMKILPSFLFWQTVRNTGVWCYEINLKTGDRRAFQHNRAFEPLDLIWLMNAEGKCWYFDRHGNYKSLTKGN